VLIHYFICHIIVFSAKHRGFVPRIMQVFTSPRRAGSLFPQYIIIAWRRPIAEVRLQLIATD